MWRCNRITETGSRLSHCATLRSVSTTNSARLCHCQTLSRCLCVHLSGCALGISVMLLILRACFFLKYVLLFIQKHTFSVSKPILRRLGWILSTNFYSNFYGCVRNMHNVHDCLLVPNICSNERLYEEMNDLNHITDICHKPQLQRFVNI